MSAAMGLVPLVCLFVAAWSGITAADGPTVVPLVVKENEEVVLECSLGENAQGKIFSWTKDGDEVITINLPPTPPHIEPLFQGRVSHFPEALQSGDASIRISRAKVSDGGRYICEFPNENPKTRASISLIVGAAGKPTIRILGRTEIGLLLQCVVLGAFPKPHVEWRDSAGTVLQAEEPQVASRDGKYDTVLNITVTMSDNFKCFATQREIYHQLHDETFVYPFGRTSTSIPWYGWLGIIAAIFCTVASGCALGWYFREHSKKSKSKKEGRDQQQESVALQVPIPGAGLPNFAVRGRTRSYQCAQVIPFSEPLSDHLEANKHYIPNTATQQSKTCILILEGGSLHSRTYSF